MVLVVYRPPDGDFATLITSSNATHDRLVFVLKCIVCCIFNSAELIEITRPNFFIG
jgi:hypothetical protein